MASDAAPRWFWPQENFGETSHTQEMDSSGALDEESWRAFETRGPDSHDDPNEPFIEPTDPEPTAQPRPERHYPPRQCRICLEVVLPTFEAPAEGVSSMFNPAPRVNYTSSDPESGRLIRPCKCKGSQKYVHEACLQAWRHADPAYGRRNFFECPTCGFRYQLERLRWSRIISSTLMQLLLTVVICFTTIFVFGFIADPIINLYLDPYDTITSGGTPEVYLEYEETSWYEHFAKGVASLGLLGGIQAIFTMSPWNWWNLRQLGVFGGGGRRRRGTGRDRLEDISWSLVLIGIFTFLYAVWKWVRLWSRRTLEKAGERVADVQGDNDDDDEAEIKEEPTS